MQTLCQCSRMNCGKEKLSSVVQSAKALHCFWRSQDCSQVRDWDFTSALAWNPLCSLFLRHKADTCLHDMCPDVGSLTLRLRGCIIVLWMHIYLQSSLYYATMSSQICFNEPSHTILSLRRLYHFKCLQLGPRPIENEHQIQVNDGCRIWVGDMYDIQISNS